MPRGTASLLTCLALTALCLACANGRARAGDANSANNPLTKEVTVFIQDYVSPSLNRIGGDGNSFQLRGLVPYQLFDTSHLVRFTLPVDTVQNRPGTSVTELSNLAIFDLTLVPVGGATLGFGPLLAAFTAGGNALGSGKWQPGGAAVAVVPSKAGIAAAVLTYQHSFGGARDRRPTSLLTLQPILTYNLPNKFYLRSSRLYRLTSHGTQPSFPSDSVSARCGTSTRR